MILEDICVCLRNFAVVFLRWWLWWFWLISRYFLDLCLWIHLWWFALFCFFWWSAQFSSLRGSTLLPQGFYGLGLECLGSRSFKLLWLLNSSLKWRRRLRGRFRELLFFQIVENDRTFIFRGLWGFLFFNQLAPLALMIDWWYFLALFRFYLFFWLFRWLQSDSLLVSEGHLFLWFLYFFLLFFLSFWRRHRIKDFMIWIDL